MDLYRSLLCHLFFVEPAATEIYTLSLHDALPISSISPFGRNAIVVGDDSPLTALRTPRLLSSTEGWAAAIPPVSTIIADRKSTRLNSSHVEISYAVFCLKKKNPRFYDSFDCGFIL